MTVPPRNDASRCVPVAGEPDARIEIPSQPTFLAPLRAFITTVAERCGFDDVAQFQVALAIDEAVANVINHGYARRPDGRIWILLWRLPDEASGLQIVIEDLGRQVDPSQIRSRDLEDVRPGGLGVHIIKEVMDYCRWERRPEGGMRLVLAKFVASSAAGDDAGGNRSVGSSVGPCGQDESGACG